MIPAAKLEGLRAALERDGEVEFTNGAKVRRETVVEIIVEGRWGTVRRYPEKDLERAYDMALHGEQRRVPRPPPETPEDDPPPF